MLIILEHKSNFRILPGNGSHKLIEADSTISIFIGIVDHLVNLLGSELFAHLLAHFLEVLSAEAARAGWVEDLIELLEGCLGLCFGLAENLDECCEVELFGSGGGLHNGDDIFSFALEVKCFNSINDFGN